ncbi:MAG: TetR/AcrR family transcriptional regulator [Cellulomonas sp.]|nr:TetR/AcrR family transcriptional regulator [Cellulomonas sp.]
MGRPPGFEVAEVIRAARDVFWDRGLDGSSLPDLEHATGLSRSSIYHAFGSKRGLFDAAVQDYLDTVVRPRLAVLTDEPVGPDAVRTYFRTLAQAVATLPDDSPRRGCLLLTCATTAAHDPALAEVVEDYRAELTGSFARALSARYPAASLARLARRARQLTSLTVAGLVLAKVNRDEAVATLRAGLEQVNEWDQDD